MPTPNAKQAKEDTCRFALRMSNSTMNIAEFIHRELLDNGITMNDDLRWRMAVIRDELLHLGANARAFGGAMADRSEKAPAVTPYIAPVQEWRTARQNESYPPLP